MSCGRPYPRMCASCSQRTVEFATIPYRFTIWTKQEITVEELPVNRCDQCGAVTFDLVTDAAIVEAVRAAGHPNYGKPHY